MISNYFNDQANHNVKHCRHWLSSIVGGVFFLPVPNPRVMIQETQLLFMNSQSLL